MKRRIQGPSEPQSLLNGGAPYAKHVCPRLEWPRLAARRKKQVRAPIVRLHLDACPSAVVGRVPLIVVDPVQRGPFVGLRSHGVQEVSKTIGSKPLGAYADPAPAVVRERTVRRVIAAANHAVPRFVFKGAARKVGSVNLLRSADQETTTGFHRPTAEVAEPRNLCRATTALTKQPVNLSNVRQDRQLAENGTENMRVFHKWHYGAKRMGWAKRIAANLMEA
jgi:hypothetical protein